MSMGDPSDPPREDVDTGKDRHGSSEKTSVAQMTAGLATSWMPRPLADFFSTPFGAAVFLIAALILLITGIIWITRNDALPSISINRQRAVVVARQIDNEGEQESRRRSPQPGLQPGALQQPSPRPLQPDCRSSIDRRYSTSANPARPRR
jgi:hypothetical protein